MNNREICEDDIVEIGTVSEETKGEALIDQDVGGGQQRFLMGIVQD